MVDHLFLLEAFPFFLLLLWLLLFVFVASKLQKNLRLSLWTLRFLFFFIILFFNWSIVDFGPLWWLNGKEFVRHRFDPWLTKISGEGNGNPLRYSRLSCLGNPMDREAQWATDHAGAESQTWLRERVHTYTQCVYVNPKLLIYPVTSPFVFRNHKFVFLHLWHYFCFVNKSICIIFLDFTYKQYYMMFVFDWLTSLSMIISRPIHLATNGIFCSFMAE